MSAEQASCGTNFSGLLQPNCGCYERICTAKVASANAYHFRSPRRQAQASLPRIRNKEQVTSTHSKTRSRSYFGTRSRNEYQRVCAATDCADKRHGHRWHRKARRRNRTVVIKGDYIQLIAASHEHTPWSAKVIDLHNQTIMPSIINAHGHLGLTKGTPNQRRTRPTATFVTSC